MRYLVFALAFFCIGSAAHAQSALEWAVAQGANARLIQPQRPAARELRGIDVSGGNYRLFNNSGATRTFTGVAGLRTRTAN